MAYEVRVISDIDNKNIKLGKTFKYSLGNDSNYNLTNIYYIKPNICENENNLDNSNSLPKEYESKKQDNIDDKTKLIIQTPLMYIPNSMIYFNEKPFLELSFNNEDNDKDVSEFKIWITNLEEYLFKLIKKRTSLGIEKSNMCSILKGNNSNYSNYSNYTSSSKRSTKLIVPINTNISKCILNDDCNNKKSKILFNWEIPVPTYAISIIWIKNIWLKKGKWGINLFMYASRVMNSHMLDPIEFMDLDSNNKTIKLQDIKKQFKDDKNESIEIGQIPEYTTYFKMLKMGIPKDAIKQKMSILGLDTRYIDYPETTQYITFMHYISNPNLKPFVNSYNKSIIENSDEKSDIESKGSIGNIGGIGKGILSSIIGGGIKLKKVDINDQKDLKDSKINIKDKILNNIIINNNQLKVPSLNDIQGALSRLKKLNIDDTTI